MSIRDYLRKKFPKRETFKKKFKGQNFRDCFTHTIIKPNQFPLGSKWFDIQMKQYGRIIGYPLNDYYHADYVGMHYADGSEGASRAVNLVKQP